MPLTECVVLIPKVKIITRPAAFCSFLTAVTDTFGGYTFDGEVTGSLLNRKAGIVHSDTSVTILILIDDEQAALSMLKQFVAIAAYELAELALFMATVNVTQFVWAH